jgi:hypothetical protein
MSWFRLFNQFFCKFSFHNSGRPLRNNQSLVLLGMDNPTAANGGQWRPMATEGALKAPARWCLALTATATAGRWPFGRRRLSPAHFFLFSSRCFVVYLHLLLLFLLFFEKVCQHPLQLAFSHVVQLYGGYQSFFCDLFFSNLFQKKKTWLGQGFPFFGYFFGYIAKEFLSSFYVQALAHPTDPEFAETLTLAFANVVARALLSGRYPP